ncbi:MAG TPA: hypothetical protein IAC03_02635 [Candidatus Coprenecus pullistercoris]|nr:hypothetical protein [Candidatus Coprenecus pullistercoris]
MRRILLILAALSAPLALNAQKLLWDVDFKFGFDNREYMKLTTSPSNTTFGAMLAPKVGLGWGEGHSVYAGVDIYKYFGQSDPALSFDYLLYYQFDGKYFKANAGAFPRKRLSGHYPKAFFDEHYFFDGNIEGALLSYTRKWWRIEGAVDWVGCMDEVTRERFSVYSYGQAGAPWLNLSYSFMMTHYAGSGRISGVVDNVWLYPHLSSDLSAFLPRNMYMNIRAGWLQTFQNDRVSGDGYVLPGGFQGEVSIEYWGFGISNTVFAGDNLMPFYYTEDALGIAYGSDLYYGDLFYSTDSGIYDRLEISYHYDFKDFLRLKVASVHHYDGYGWGWQQLVQLTVNLNNFQFPSRNDRHHR